MAANLDALEAEGLRMPECMHVWQAVARKFDLGPEHAVFTAAELAALVAGQLAEAKQTQNEKLEEAGGSPLCEISC